MARFLWLLLTALVASCSSGHELDLSSDNGQINLAYACTEAGAVPRYGTAADLARQIVARENAEHILAETNPFLLEPEVGTVREAKERRDWRALETAVANFICVHGRPPSRPPRFPEPGSQPPDFTAPVLASEDSSATSVRLSELRGRTVVVVFWSTWCPACREEYETLQRLSSRQGPGQVSTYAILHSDTEANLRRWQSEHGAGVTFLVDEQKAIARLYRVFGIPHTVVVRPDGRLHVSGHVHPRDLEATVDSAAKFIESAPAGRSETEIARAAGT